MMIRIKNLINVIKVKNNGVYMKVALIFPRNKKHIEAGGNNYPLGILYLASYLKKMNINFKIFDTTFIDEKTFKNQIMEYKPDVIGVSIFTPIVGYGLKIIKMTKKLLPNVKIVVGGPHACVDTENLIKIKEIDIILIGEGEKRFYYLINHLIKSEDISKISGLVYKKGNKIIRTPTRGFIENLDELPFPDPSLLDIDKYLDIGHQLVLITARGCPFNCFYCQPTQRMVFGDKLRRRSPENVVEEMIFLIDYYKKRRDWRFYFVDDTFTYNKEWIKKFCNLLKNKNINIEWACPTRVDCVDEEILKLMKSVGCRYINFGVESGSQRILDEVYKKRIKIEDVKKAFKLAHKLGIIAHAYFMVGAPTETKEDLEMSVNLIKEIRPDNIQVSVTTPMIGSNLYKYCKDKEIINVQSFDDYDYCKNDYPIKLKNLNKEDIKKYKNKLIRTWKMNLYKNSLKYLKIFITSDNKMLYIKTILNRIF